MSSLDTESPAAAPGGNNQRPLALLVVAAVALSLISVVLNVLLLLRSPNSAIEQASGEIKEAIESNGGTVAKRIDNLKDACIDWQTVLKTAAEKPDATFKIVKGEDGLLNLAEIKAEAK